MGAYLSQPVTEKELFEGRGSDVVYGGGAMQGWRRTMEDAHLAVTGLEKDPSVSIFGVFDGHGGSEVALFCQKYLAEEFQRLSDPDESSIEDSLVQVFHRVDDMLRDNKYAEELEQLKTKDMDEDTDKGNESEGVGFEGYEMLKRFFYVKRLMGENGNGNGEGSKAASEGEEQPIELADTRVQAGCTAIVAVKKGDQLIVANAGDSRGVLCRGGKAIALSEDHKPAQEIERNRIIAAGGFLSEIGGVCRVNGNLNLSRAIGDLKYKSNADLHPKDQIITAQPDICRITLCPDDQFFVLACDGVWDVMTNQEVVDFVGARLAEKLTATQAASALLDCCLAKDPKEARGVGCDNMTVVVIQLVNSS